MHELGYVEGQNLLVDPAGRTITTIAFLRLWPKCWDKRSDVLVTVATSGAAAAKSATSTVPIVGIGMADPVRTGLVNSLARDPEEM